VKQINGAVHTNVVFHDIGHKAVSRRIDGHRYIHCDDGIPELSSSRNPNSSTSSGVPFRVSGSYGLRLSWHFPVVASQIGLPDSSADRHGCFHGSSDNSFCSISSSILGDTGHSFVSPHYLYGDLLHVDSVHSRHVPVLLLAVDYIPIYSMIYIGQDHNA